MHGLHVIPLIKEFLGSLLASQLHLLSKIIKESALPEWLLGRDHLLVQERRVANAKTKMPIKPMRFGGYLDNSDNTFHGLLEDALVDNFLVNIPASLPEPLNKQGLLHSNIHALDAAILALCLAPIWFRHKLVAVLEVQSLHNLGFNDTETFFAPHSIANIIDRATHFVIVNLCAVEQVKIFNSLGFREMEIAGLSTHFKSFLHPGCCHVLAHHAEPGMSFCKVLHG